MVYIHLAEGFEEVEALTVVDVLRRAGVDAQTVSMTGSKTVCGTHGIKVEADQLFEEADYGACEMIVLPGGLPGATNLRDHAGLTEQIKSFAKAGQSLAAICAAPNGVRRLRNPGRETGHHLSGHGSRTCRSGADRTACDSLRQYHHRHGPGPGHGIRPDSGRAS